MWIDHLRNRQAIVGPFGGQAPSLDGLLFSYLLLESGRVEIGLAFKALPAGYPSRWASKGFDSLLLRLEVHGVLTFSATGGWGDTASREVTLEAGNNLLRVSALHDPSRLSVGFAPNGPGLYGHLDPYNAREALDLQVRPWRR